VAIQLIAVSLIQKHAAVAVVRQFISHLAQRVVLVLESAKVVSVSQMLVVVFLAKQTPHVRAIIVQQDIATVKTWPMVPHALAGPVINTALVCSAAADHAPVDTAVEAIALDSLLTRLLLPALAALTGMPPVISLGIILLPRTAFGPSLMVTLRWLCLLHHHAVAILP